MLIRAIFAFLVLPVVMAGLFPWLISQISASVIFRWTYGGGLLMLGGGCLLVASVVSFYRRGHGTLAPWDPPRRLVERDLYHFCRNPMYVGIVLILFGWALVTGKLWNYVYAAAAPFVFHLRVVWYEERQLERQFGAQWLAYRDAVPRWGWRWPKSDKYRLTSNVDGGIGSTEPPDLPSQAG
jgi:protein-S-isoprenylcysteine O-methyltransferase Ste14